MAFWLICVAAVLLLAAAGWWAARMVLGYLMLVAMMEFVTRVGTPSDAAAAEATLARGYAWRSGWTRKSYNT